MLMQPFSILQQSRPPICMQFVAFQSHRMSDRAPTEGEIKRHKICQIDRVSEKKTSDRMSDVNPWISDLKRQDLQQIESQPFGRPGGDHCYVM